MLADSITNVSIPSVPTANARDLGKKKRARIAKLKQSKLDVRREQWLSQGAVKNKGCKEEMNSTCTVPVPTRKEDDRSLEKLEMRQRREENNGSSHGDSDFSESLSNSPNSVISGILGGNDSGPLSSGSSSASGCGGSYSGSITEEEGDGDDGCLDDWEVFADALAANDKEKTSCSQMQPESELVSQLIPPCDTRTEDSKLDSARMVQGSFGNKRAWSPDDSLRPQSLPNLSKQFSLPNPDRRFNSCGVPWARGSVISAQATACPICYEDLDMTDSSFLPCLCGFHICLFCHNRILEEDGRCPGCRKPYVHDPVDSETSVRGGSLTLRLARSCSMATRS